jgi:sphingomyelin phosphodiesterase 2
MSINQYTRRQCLRLLGVGALTTVLPRLSKSPTYETKNHVQQADTMHVSQENTTQQLRVLTLNVWGTPIAHDKSERMRAIGAEIARQNLDIVGLQEIWMREDLDLILKELQSSQLKHYHYFPSGVTGSGLVILSRFPIIDANFYRFRLSGKPENIWQGDYLGGKGVGFVRIESSIGQIDIYDVHALAQYESNDADEYKGQRAAEMYELARYIHFQSIDMPVIFFGDFNVSPDQLGYRVAKTLGALTDTYAVLYPNDLGATVSSQNPYRSDTFDTKRIDYVMLRNGRSLGILPKTSEITFKLIPDSNGKKAFSDHFGVLVELVILPMTNGFSYPISSEVKHVLVELSNVVRTALNESQLRERQHVTQTILGSIGTVVLVASANIITRTKKRFGSVLKYAIAPLSTFYSIVQGSLAIFVVPDEMHSLEAILSEVDIQLEAGRAFNGVEFDAVLAQNIGDQTRS